MKKTIIAMTIACAVSALAQAPAPYPVTINSRSATAPQITMYRASEHGFRVSYVDGSTASVITNYTPFMSWATSATATSVSTASYSVVSGSTGVVDFTFSPSSVNYAAGRYVYEVGLLSGTTPRMYRRGVLVIEGSPYSTGADPVTWTTNITWSAYNYLTAGDGPAIADGTTITQTTNAGGQLVFAASGSLPAITGNINMGGYIATNYGTPTAASHVIDKGYADATYQPLESTLTDIADGTIAENLVNTSNPWADNEVADTLTIGAGSTVALGALPAAVVTNNETGLTLSGTFSGNMSGGTNLNASNIASGTLAAARLPSDGYASTYVNVSGDVMTGDLVLTNAAGTRQIALYSSTNYIGLASQVGTAPSWLMSSQDIIAYPKYPSGAGTMFVGGNLNVTGASALVGGLTVTNGAVTIDAANAYTNTVGGALTVLGLRVASGSGTTASGGTSHAEGLATTASGEGSHAEGLYTTASSSTSHAEGNSTTASGDASHAEGGLTTASGDYSHAEGLSTVASGYVSHAAGQAATASHTNSYVWSDGTATASSAAQQYTVYATGGTRLMGGNTSIGASTGTSKLLVTSTLTNAPIASFVGPAVPQANQVMAGVYKGATALHTVDAEGDEITLGKSTANNFFAYAGGTEYVWAQPSGKIYISGNVPNIALYDTTSGHSDMSITQNSDALTFTDDEAGLTLTMKAGNVGIGTNTSPRCKLDVPFGAIASGYTAAYTNAGPTDNLDVSAKNTIFVNASGGSVTIGGLAGGVAGQVLRIVRTESANDVILEHAEGGGSQDIYLSTEGDETLSTYGGWTLMCNGTAFYEVDN